MVGNRDVGGGMGVADRGLVWGDLFFGRVDILWWGGGARGWCRGIWVAGGWWWIG